MPKDTNLHKAAYKGAIDVVQDLLNAGDDVNCRGAQKRTPLHRAIGKGHTDVVEVLIEAGADINLRDAGGMTPLHWAALFGFLPSGKLLLDHGDVEVNATTNRGETALHLAAEKGNDEFIELLMRHGVDFNILNEDKKTAYDMAKAEKKAKTAELLKPHTASAQGCCVVM